MLKDMQAHTPNRKRAKAAPAYDPAADVIRPYHIRQATGLSTTTVWRYRQRGAFPEAIRLSDGTIGWRRADIAAWLDSRGRA